MSFKVLNEKELENVTGAANNSLEQPFKNVEENHLIEEIDIMDIANMPLFRDLFNANFRRPAPQTNRYNDPVVIGTAVAGAGIALALYAAALGAGYGTYKLGKYAYNKLKKNKKTKPSV